MPQPDGNSANDKPEIDLEGLLAEIQDEKSPGMEKLPPVLKGIVSKYTKGPVEQRQKLEAKLKEAEEKANKYNDDELKEFQTWKEKKSKSQLPDDEIIKKNIEAINKKHLEREGFLKNVIHNTLIDSRIELAAKESIAPDLLISYFRNEFELKEVDGQFLPMHKTKPYDDLGNLNTVDKLVKSYLDDHSELRKPSDKKGTGTTIQNGTGKAQPKENGKESLIDQIAKARENQQKKK